MSITRPVLAALAFVAVRLAATASAASIGHRAVVDRSQSDASAPVSRDIVPASHLWPGHPVCRRLRLRGWRWGIWESRAAWRLHCRGRVRAIGWRQCRRWRVRGWRWGERWARIQYRRHCAY